MTLKKVFAAVLAALIMLAALPTGALAARAVKATTMRLVLAEGDVEVREESGRKLTHSEGMQLYSGYEVETGQQSAAYLSLDDKSAVMLDAFSMLKLKDSGKKLELQLLEGDLLTNVSEKLLGGESFNISTSTMTTGIRGTLVLVRVRNGETTVTVLEGRVEITLHNEGGRVVIVEADHYVCDADNQVLPLNEEDLPAYVVRILREDRELLDRVSPEVQEYVLGISEARLEEMEEQEAGEYYEIYVQPEEGTDTDGGAIVDQVFRNDGIPGVPAGRPAVPPALPGDPVVTALDAEYDGTAHPVVTVSMAGALGYMVEYSLDGGLSWTETCPTVTTVADCEGLEVTVRLSREGEDSKEAVYYPVLNPAPRSFTVTVADYYLGAPVLPIYEGELYDTDSGYSLTENYEASDGQGGWVALDEQPTTPGDYRVTVDITSDNYQPASGSAEFRVLKPSAITELALTDIAFDDQTVTLSGTVSALWEQGVDGLTAPESLLVTLELLRSGDNATEFVEVSLDPDPQIAGAYTGVIEAQPDLPGVIWVSASACEDNNAVTYEVPEHQAASYTTAVYLLEVADEAAGTITQSFFTDWAGLSDALQLSQTPQFIGESVNLWVLRNETGTPADGYTELGGDLEIAGALTASTSVNLVIPAGTTVANSGSVDIEDGAAMTVGGTLNNTGIVTSQQLITVESGAVVYSSEGGEIWLTGASGDPSVMNVETGGTLTMDSGSVLVLAPSATPTLQGVVNNSGVINLNNDVTDYNGDGGVIEFNGGSITNSGIMTFQPGTYLNTIFDTAYPVTLTNEATGLIEIYSASVYLDRGTLTNSGEINVMSGSYLSLGSQEGGTNAAELENLAGGSLTVGADSTLGLYIGEGSNAGTITVEGAVVNGEDSFGGFLIVGEGYTLTNTGTIDKQAASADDSASMEIYGTVYSSGTINSVGYVYVHGTLSVEVGGILNLGWGEFSLYGTLLNDGTLTMEGTDGQLSVMSISGYEDAALFENGGVADLVAYVQLSSTVGDMVVDNTVSNTMGASFTVGETCTLELNDACSLDVQVGSSFVNNGSIICETINVTDVSVITNNGTINGFTGTEWSQI